MSNGPLDCRQARERLEAYLGGADSSPALAAHLAACETCLEAVLEAALRRPPAVPVPGDFSARLLASLPPARYQAPPSVLPHAVAAACALFAVWGVAVLPSTYRWLEQLGDQVGRWALAIRLSLRPEWALSLLAAEAAIALFWVWRESRT